MYKFVNTILSVIILIFILAVNSGTFEEAIKVTGFGRFNIALVCTITAASFAQIVEQISTSYVIPIAQCDLDLSLENKGLLVSFSYTGEYFMFHKKFPLNEKFTKRELLIEYF